LRERREELLKREDERFEDVVKGLGSEQEQQRVSSAVLLPTFLRKGYERFYLQVFNLAAGNLRTHDEPGPKLISPGPLARALISVFRESYARARDALKEDPKISNDVRTGRYLNAAGVRLGRAFLAGADFRDAWLREASLREAILRGANLAGANLEACDCVRTDLGQATLQKTNLKQADLSGANLENADLSGTRGDNAKFKQANLSAITMDGGTLGGADLSGADLSRARFQNVDFASASPDGVAANPEAAEKVLGAVFDNVTGLSVEQINLLRQKGATISMKSQLTVEPSPAPARA
jgi:hypothetical protein